MDKDLGTISRCLWKMKRRILIKIIDHSKSIWLKDETIGGMKGKMIGFKRGKMIGDTKGMIIICQVGKLHIQTRFGRVKHLNHLDLSKGLTIILSIRRIMRKPFKEL